ncbi:MAG TPA: anthranilate synthase component I family protein, partial [Candidatus Saccharimonadales bacterium]|nr:anthranilate synthase component I family protein [Candidatus Saccharimonadales bacterium]
RPLAPGGESRQSASLDRAGYLAAVGEIRRLIAAGDCYEVNLTRRLTTPGGGVDPVRLFGELLTRNPAPFAAYLESSRGVLVGSSPERYLRVRDGRAETRPIKGTARRSPDAEDDLRAAKELNASAKNRAENVMIVDLARNDLGRVCAPGTIRVEDLCRLESYEGLHHLVSVVAGRLEPGAGAMDAARALFPPGSMTGAPKIRAMEIIERLEPVRRGPYAGVAGYLSAAGDLDLSVVIRSFLLSEHGADLQVGGAVVADSEPESEFEESVLKSERALEALAAVARAASAGGGRDG